MKTIQRELEQGLSLKNMDLKSMEKTFDKIADRFTQKITKAVTGLRLQEARSEGRRTAGGRVGIGAVSEIETMRTYKNMERFELAIAKKVEAQRRKDRLNVAREESRIARNETRFGPSVGAFGATPSDFSGAMGDFNQQRQGARNRGRGKAARRGLAAAGGAGAAGLAGIGIAGQAAEFEFRSFQDITQGRVLEDVARQRGRTGTRGAVGGAAGALAGAAGGAAGGAMLGSVFGPVGTAVGGVLGGIGGGIAGAFGGRAAMGEVTVAQQRPIQQAFQMGRGQAGGRLQAMRGGGVSSAQLTGLQGMGAAEGITTQDTLNQFTGLRGQIGNAGAQAALPDLQRMMTATGADIGTQGQFLETLMAGGGQGVQGGVAQQQRILEQAFARGLDTSKTSMFLKTTNEFVQQNMGLGRINTEEIANKLSRLSEAFAEGGEVTPTTLRQSRELMQMQQQESTSMQGMAGLGNIAAVMGAMEDPQFAQFGAGGFLALSKLAQDDDVESALDTLEKQAQNEGMNFDRKEAKKSLNRLQERKGQAIIEGSELASGGNALIASFLVSQERGQTFGQAARGMQRTRQAGEQRTLERLGFEPTGQDLTGGVSGMPTEEEALMAGMTREELALQREREAVTPGLEGARAEVLAAPEAQLLREQARLDVTQIQAGLNEFGTAVTRIRDQSNELADALETAAKRLRGEEGFSPTSGLSPRDTASLRGPI